MPLQKLDHYLIYARDLAETKNFYVRVLGLREGPRPPFPFPGCWLYLGDAPCVHLAEARANPAQEEYLGAGERRDGAGTGAIDHVAFAATGLSAMLATLERHGIEATRRTVPEQRMHQLFFRDPNGITIELTYAASELDALEGGS